MTEGGRLSTIKQALPPVAEPPVVGVGWPAVPCCPLLGGCVAPPPVVPLYEADVGYM